MPKNKIDEQMIKIVIKYEVYHNFDTTSNIIVMKQCNNNNIMLKASVNSTNEIINKIKFLYQKI